MALRSIHVAPNCMIHKPESDAGPKTMWQYTRPVTAASDRPSNDFDA